MKKAGFCALSLLLLLLPGCMRSVQLNERAIVQAIGLDKEDGEYVLTLQIFDPESEKGDDTSGGKILHARGKTISQAMRNANLKQGQEIFLAHTKLLILGEDIAQEGIKTVMDYFNAEPQFRPTVDVLLADTKAQKVLNEPLDSSILPVLSTKMMLEGYRDSAELVRTQLLGIAGSLENPAVGSYLPVAAFSGDEKNPGIQIVGAAVLRDGRKVGVFLPQETRGILWAAGQVGKIQLTLEEEGGATTLDVVDAVTKVSAQIKDGKPFYEVSIRVQSNVSEELSFVEGLSFSQRCDRSEKEQEQLIEQETTHVLDRFFHELSCDALGYANILAQQQPDYWREHRECYADSLDQVSFSVEVESTINRGGSALPE